MLVIGSVAMERHGHMSDPNDLDVIATFDELNELTRKIRKLDGVRVLSVPMSGNKTVLKVIAERAIHPSYIEVEIAWPGSTGEELLNHAILYKPVNWKASKLPILRDAKTAPIDVLYTLKMSHRYLKDSVHFDKTMKHIHMMRKMGAKIFDEDWLKRREKETYTYDHPNLRTTKQAFFKLNEGVNYIYDHDSIHMAMAHIDKTGGLGDVSDISPAYKFYAGDGEVLSSKKKFFELPEMVRLYGVLEEAQVLALERSQIPYGIAGQYAFGTEIDRIRRIHGISQIHLESPPSPRRSFDIALRKVCTSITSGWFREFAWENFYTVEQMYEPDYVDRFWDAVRRGIVFRTQSSLEKERIDQEKQDDYRRNAGTGGHTPG